MYKRQEYFDILILRDQAAVQVRDNKIEAILPLADYRYSGVPAVSYTHLLGCIAAKLQDRCMETGRISVRFCRNQITGRRKLWRSEKIQGHLNGS